MAESLKQLEELIRTAPDPSADRAGLIMLRDGDPAARRLAERLHKDPWRRSSLGKLLPGLALIDSALFRFRLGARAANALARAGISSWVALAGSTPAELFSLSGIGNETVEEILCAAVGEWGTAYLRTAEDASEGVSAQGTMPKQLQGLIGRAPDPIAERERLHRLLNTDDASAQQLVKRLHEDGALRYLPLRQLLPGVGLVESPAFSIKLSVRAANCLGRADFGRLSALAGLAPVDILELPEVGVKVAEEILAVVLSEWAAAYLASVETSPPADRPANGASPGRLDGEDGQAPIMTADLAGLVPSAPVGWSPLAELIATCLSKQRGRSRR